MALLMILAVVAGVAVGQVPSNPCTNGSFEELGADGFPMDWQPVWETVEVTADAHSGQRALRFVRTADTKCPETGLNRAWAGDNGQRGAMIDRVKGGIEFWYKAVSGSRDNVVVCVIPMNERPLEETTARRTLYTIPTEHVGDGQWHHARMKYDYSKAPGVRWVHFGARLTGGKGELILDDVAYLDQVGPMLQITNVGLDESADHPGNDATVRAHVVNAGDATAHGVHVTLSVPSPVTATPADSDLGDLEPDARKRLSWHLQGERTTGTLTLMARSAENEARRDIEITPKLVIESFGPQTPVVQQGVPAALECVVRNTGNGCALELAAAFECAGKQTTATEARVAPGKSCLLRTTFTPEKQTPKMAVSVSVKAPGAAPALTEASEVIVGTAKPAPPPIEHLSATAAEESAILENEHVRLVFLRNEFGFGAGQLFAKVSGKWEAVGWLPYLTRVAYRDGSGGRREQCVYAGEPPKAHMAGAAQLRFACPVQDGAHVLGHAVITFELAENDKIIVVCHRFYPEQPFDLLAFDGPMVYATQRDEAIYPGLEWLVDDEVSSGSLDIAEDHSDRVRYVVHPNWVTIPAIAIQSRNGVLGLLWYTEENGYSVTDRPSPVFASPDRFNHQRSHLAGLMLPSVPDYLDPNTRQAARPYPVKPGQPLDIRCAILVDGDAKDPLTAIEAWFQLFGFPTPAPLPRGSYEGEIQFSMRGYLESLWIADAKEWWTSKGAGPTLCGKGRPHLFLADLLAGALLSPEEAVRQACANRVQEVLALVGSDARIDAQRFYGRADLAIANAGSTGSLLASRGDDGAWRFDANKEDHGVFEGLDYHTLGPDKAVEVGTCARNACNVLRYARIVGDWDVYRRMCKTLELMEGFRVPRAAQVWEVPVHTPDILAAADAVDAYIEAYRLCRAYGHADAERWLRDAVTWARRGLPFVYCWDDPKLPFLKGATIPVFGASLYTCSWFGRPVQWNGLVYANAILKLAEYDTSAPWRQIAETITRSALYQQDTEGENAALWPDNLSAITGEKCVWMFAPRTILGNVYKLIGRDEDPATCVVGSGDARLHITTTAAISDTSWADGTLAFRATYPAGEQGVILIANASKPKAVLVDGAPAAERAQTETGPDAGWRHDRTTAFLCVRVAHDRASTIRVEDVAFAKTPPLPEPVNRIDFSFDASTDGWFAQNDIDALRAENGVLAGNILGPDPYVVRPLISIRGEDCPVLVLRMKLTSGTGGQFYWGTESSPGFDEAKCVRFDVQADGEFHEYRLEPGRDPQWAGQHITALRIDPGNGATAGRFEIDYLRKPKP